MTWWGLRRTRDPPRTWARGAVMRRPFLKTLRTKVEAALTAVAFAEEREVEMAREILSQAEPHDGGSSRR